VKPPFLEGTEVEDDDEGSELAGDSSLSWGWVVGEVMLVCV
jgi:hypothetical protein